MLECFIVQFSFKVGDLTWVVQGEPDPRELFVRDAECEHAADLHALQSAVAVARHVDLLLHLCVDAARYEMMMPNIYSFSDNDKVKIIMILIPTHLSVSTCGTTGALAVGADCLVSSVTFSPSDMSCNNDDRRCNEY